MITLLLINAILLQAPTAAPVQVAAPQVEAIEGLKSDDPTRRLNALQYLELHPSAPASDDLLALLKSSDVKVRRAAIRTLGFTRNLGLAASVVPLLQDPEAGIRVSAIFALMRMGAANEGERFAALAQDADPNVGLAARTALAYFGRADNREELRRALAGQDFGSISLAAAGLGLLGRPEDVSEVCGLLGDRRDEVRSYGAQALLDSPPGEGSLNALMDALDKESYFYVQQAMVRSAAFLGMRMVPLFSDRLIRSKVVKELLAEARMYPGYPDLAASLAKRFDAGAENYRQMLDVMLVLGGAEAVQGLKAAALDPKNRAERRQDVLIALGKLGDAGLVPAVRPLLKDKEPPVRAGACAALAALGDAESGKALVVLFKDASPVVRMAALRAVNRLKLTQALDAVKPLLEDPDEKVREVANRTSNALQRAKEAAMNDPIFRLGHDAFLIQAGGRNIYFDPFQLPAGLPKADLIFVTHDHYDHLSPDDIRKIATEKTELVLPKVFAGKVAGLPGKVTTLAAGGSATVAGVEVRAVPAYNPDKKYHPKSYGGLGYFAKIGGTTYYHAGDTDLIPEMGDFPAADVCFLPVSGTYVMTAAEAAEATKILKCKKAIPMHYGAIVGTDGDAEAFKKAAACPVEILPVSAPR